MCFKKLAIYFLCFISVCLYGQTDKASRLFQLGNYIEATKLYEKAVKKDTSILTLRKLGECYVKVRDYVSAEKTYNTLVNRDPTNTDDSYQYAVVLLNQGNYSNAIHQLEKLQQIKKYEQKCSNQLKFCKKIQAAKKSDTAFAVSNNLLLSTNKNEFSPSLVNDDLVYSSVMSSFSMYEVPQNQTVYGLVKQKTLKLKSPSVSYNSKKSSFNGINKSGSIGTTSFSDTDQVLYYTYVSKSGASKDSGKINKPSIYFSKLVHNKWTKSQAFQWNDSRYSFEHPTISADGKYLVFSSNMPGGYGKSDLYVCEKQNNLWTKPENLGEDINTSENEVFPYFFDNNNLYFSSDGHPGFGGLDLFICKGLSNKWLFPQNLGVVANSNKDDFGICFLYKDSIGLFTSNRIGGLGGDDIYNIISLRKETLISANVFLTENLKNPAKNRKVYLLSSEGYRLDSTTTNQFGHFAFKTFTVDKSFMVEVADDDEKLKNKPRYYIIDNNGNTTRISHKLNPNQKFVFKNLPIDPNSMPDLFDESDLNMAGNILMGKDKNIPLANRKVMLMNDFGDVVEETMTNELGSFAFRNLPPGQNYSIYVNDENLPNDAQLTITNKQGKEIKTTRVDEQNNLNFDILAIDKSSLNDISVGDEELLMQLNGYLYDQDRKAMVNANIVILDNEIAVQNILTDAKGKFKTQNLSVKKTYLFTIDDPDDKYKYVTKLYMADSKGRIYREFKRRKDGKFQFDLLNPDKYLLGDVTFEDPWLKLMNKKKTEKEAEVIISENLNYPSGAWKVDNEISKILDKVIFVLNANPTLAVELSSHTDSRGSDAFNMDLSKKRAKAAYDYLLTKGFSRSRLTAKGYGETKLLNKCTNDTACEDAEHGINRRTEFRMYQISIKQGATKK